jgi:O-methyltransferase
MEQELRQMYLDIVRKTILGFTYRDPSFDAGRGQQVPFNQEARELGEDWPILAQSMAGNKRLQNIQTLAEDIFANNIPGDFIETGVWRGGSCIFMSAILRAYGITDRDVYVCDSFEGLPPPKEHEYPVDRGDTHHTAPFLAVDLEQVQTNFEGYDLLTDQVKFVKGWFSDTLPGLEIEKLALLRLDGDMYESTIVALENLYPKLSVGGYVIVDDYGLPNCRRAIADYREFHGIDTELITIDNSSVYFQKTKDLDADKVAHRFKNTEPPPPAPIPTFSVPNRGGSISSVF